MQSHGSECCAQRAASTVRLCEWTRAFLPSFKFLQKTVIFLSTVHCALMCSLYSCIPVWKFMLRQRRITWSSFGCDRLPLLQQTISGFFTRRSRILSNFTPKILTEKLPKKWTISIILNWKNSEFLNKNKKGNRMMMKSNDGSILIAANLDTPGWKLVGITLKFKCINVDMILNLPPNFHHNCYALIWIFTQNHKIGAAKD